MTRTADHPSELDLRANVPLAPLTTLAVGGPARWLARAGDPAALRAALSFAAARALPVFVLGEGSNVLVSDDGFPGLVLQVTDRSREVLVTGAPHLGAAGAGCPGAGAGPLGSVTVRVGAGCVWDELVAWAVAEELAGVECLNGIPGLAGAAPVQNIGAYGQEVAETVHAVHVVDRNTGASEVLPAAVCGFGYRTSRFKEADRERLIVVALELTLQRGGAPALRYPELVRQVAERCAPQEASLALVRETVLAIRRAKSMVRGGEGGAPGADPRGGPGSGSDGGTSDGPTAGDGTAADPNRNSAGSFFLNPVVPEDALPTIAGRVAARGHDPATLPRYPAGPGAVKLSAAWLIERAGFPRGYARGRAGLSTRHVLALVNRGGACATELLALAREVRDGVREAFGVTLVPEPVLVGFPPAVRAELGQI